MIVLQGQCRTCYNAERIMEMRGGQYVEAKVCAYHKHAFPRAKDCREYEQFHVRMDTIAHRSHDEQA